MFSISYPATFCSFQEDLKILENIGQVGTYYFILNLGYWKIDPFFLLIYMSI